MYHTIWWVHFPKHYFYFHTMCGLRVYLYARLKSFSAAKVTVETWKSNVAILERGQIQKKFCRCNKSKNKIYFLLCKRFRSLQRGDVYLVWWSGFTRFGKPGINSQFRLLSKYYAEERKEGFEFLLIFVNASKYICSSQSVRLKQKDKTPYRST